MEKASSLRRQTLGTGLLQAMKSLSNSSGPTRARELNRATAKEELVALTGDFIDAVILNYFIKCQAMTKRIEAYIEEERARMLTIGVELNLAPVQGFFYKKTSQASEETMLNLADSNMRNRIRRLVSRGWIVERNNPHIKWDKTKQYRVNVILIDTELRAIGYHLGGWLIGQIVGEEESTPATSKTVVPIFVSEIRNGETQTRVSDSQIRDEQNATAYQANPSSYQQTSSNNTSPRARENDDAVSSSKKKAVKPRTSNGASVDPLAPLNDAQKVAARAMIEAQISPEVAGELAILIPAPAIEKQIQWFPAHKAEAETAGKPIRKDGPWLAKAIRGQYPKPQSLQRAEDAQIAQERAQESATARQAEEARQRAAQEAENERLRERRAYLDSMWETMDDEDRALVRQTALKLNGDGLALARIQRGGDIPLPMRQDAIEHLLGEGLLLEPDATAQDETQPAPVALPLPAATTREEEQLDTLWAALPDDARARIEADAGARLGLMPVNARTQGALVLMRRALLRDMFAQLAFQTPQATEDAARQTRTNSDSQERKTG